jgi:hypothetical protein
MLPDTTTSEERSMDDDDEEEDLSMPADTFSAWIFLIVFMSLIAILVLILKSSFPSGV